MKEKSTYSIGDKAYIVSFGVAILIILLLVVITEIRHHKKVIHVSGNEKQKWGSTYTVLETTKSAESKIDISGYSFSQVVRHFKNVALQDEGGNYYDVIRKWVTPVRFYAEGDVDEFTRVVLADLFAKLNSVEGFPGIYEVDSIEDANLVGYFYNDETFNVFVRQYMGNENTNGLSYLYTDAETGAIDSGVVVVRNGMTEKRRQSVINEEIVQALGLQNDTDYYPESLFYNGYNEVLEPNGLDWIIIRLLYHPLMQNGLSYNQCIPVLSKIIDH